MLKTNSLICHGKRCLPIKKRYPRDKMIKFDGKYYCERCFDLEFRHSKYRQAIYKILKKIFDLSEYDKLPRFIDLQINKYIRDYGFTEEGIYRTMCYIYFEYDFKDLNFKYGIYPVVAEYDLHHNFTFKKQEVKKPTKKVVRTRLQHKSSNVVPKIKKLELN